MAKVYSIRCPDRFSKDIFLSTDGERFLPFTREPKTLKDIEAINSIFAGNGKTKPMVVSKLWLQLIEGAKTMNTMEIA